MRYDQEVKIREAAVETRLRRRRQEEAARAKEAEEQRAALAALEVRKSRRNAADQYLRRPDAPPPPPQNPKLLRRGAGLARFYGGAHQRCSGAVLPLAANPSASAGQSENNALLGRTGGSADNAGQCGRSPPPQRGANATAAPALHLHAAASVELDTLLATARTHSSTTSGGRPAVVIPLPVRPPLMPRAAYAASSSTPVPVPVEPPQWVTLTARLADHTTPATPPRHSNSHNAASLAQVLTRPSPRLSASREAGIADGLALSAAAAAVAATSPSGKGSSTMTIAASPRPAGSPSIAVQRQLRRQLLPPAAGASVAALRLPSLTRSDSRAGSVLGPVAGSRPRYSDHLEVAAQKAARAATPPQPTRFKSLDDAAEMPMMRAGSNMAAMAEAQTRRQRDEQRRVAAARTEAATRQREKQVAEEALVREATAQAAALAVSREAAHRGAAHHPLSSSTKQVSFAPVNGVAAPPPLALYGALSDEEAPLMSSLDARLNQYAPSSGMALSNGAADVATIPVKVRQPAHAHAPLRSALRSGLSRAGHVEHAPAPPPPPPPPPPLLPPPPAPAPPASVARAEGSVQVVNPELFASLMDL